MTIVCSYCKKTIKERCGRCGGEAFPLLGVPNTLTGEQIFFYCAPCDVTFVRGETFNEGEWRQLGPSHGICPECAPKVLGELSEIAAAEKEEAP